MRYLLDTHALIWWWIDSPRLSANVRALMTDSANDFLVSAASVGKSQPNTASANSPNSKTLWAASRH